MPSVHETDANSPQRVRFVLFVAGLTPRSMRAVHSAEALCRHEFGGACNFQVIDIYREPARAVEENVIAVPLLIRYEPLPERRIIGDLSNMAQIQKSLGLKAA